MKYAKSISATLAGALAIGMVPAMALAADDDVQLLADDIAELANGTISATKAVKVGNYEIAVPTEVTTFSGKVIDLAKATDAYELAYYSVTTEDTANAWRGDWMADDENLIKGSTVAADVVTGPGTYYVAVRAIADSDVNGDDYLVVKTVITAASLAEAYLYEVDADQTVTTDVEDTVFTYTGQPISLGLTFGADGDIADDLYSITYAKKKAADGKYYASEVTNNQVIEAGDYAAIVKGADGGKYKGYEGTLYFSVGKLDLSKATLSLVDGSGNDQTYWVVTGALASAITPSNLRVNGEIIDGVALSYDGSFPETDALTKGPHTYTVSPALNADGSQVNPSIVGTDTIQVVRYAKQANIDFGAQADADSDGDVDFDASKVKVTKSATSAEALAYTLTYYKKDADTGAWVEASSLAAPGRYKAEVIVNDATYTYGGKAGYEFDVNPVALTQDGNVFLTYNGVNQKGSAIDAVDYDGTDFLKKIGISVLDAKGNKLVEGTDYVVAVTATVDGKTKAFTEIVDANDYTITVKAAEGSKYAVSASWTLTVNKAEVTPVLMNGIKAQNGKYTNWDALWTGEAVQPVTGFTVDKDLNKDGKKPDALEVAADNYSVVITSYVDKKGVAATPSTMPTEFVNPGTYTFKIVPSKTNVNFEFLNAAEISAAGEYTFEIVDDNVFADVKAGAWYADEVYEVAKANIMSGYGNGMFGPNDGMKRGDLALALGRALDMDVAPLLNGTTNTVIKVVTGFEDVDGGAYYARAIKAMADAGIMTGYGDGTYGAEELVTREQLATILCRIEASGLGDDSILMASALDAYADGDEVAGWAVPGVEWAVESGVMGVDTAFLNPGDDVTRAEVAAMLVRFDAKFDAFAAL